MTTYPNITLDLTGQDGNAFAILGSLRRALRDGGVPAEEITAIIEKAMTGDYNYLLGTVMNTVNVEFRWDDDDEDESWDDDDDEWLAEAYDEYDDDDTYDYAESI